MGIELARALVTLLQLFFAVMSTVLVSCKITKLTFNHDITSEFIDIRTYYQSLL